MNHCLVSVAQLVATSDNLCRGRSSNPRFLNLTTKLLIKKIKK